MTRIQNPDSVSTSATRNVTICAGVPDRRTLTIPNAIAPPKTNFIRGRICSAASRTGPIKSVVTVTSWFPGAVFTPPFSGKTLKRGLTADSNSRQGCKNPRSTPLKQGQVESIALFRDRPASFLPQLPVRVRIDETRHPVAILLLEHGTGRVGQMPVGADKVRRPDKNVGLRGFQGREPFRREAPFGLRSPPPRATARTGHITEHQVERRFCLQLLRREPRDRDTRTPRPRGQIAHTAG